ncbi:MAG: hypothetical protein H6612_01130 [Ignavibacteriales bacterium]|nr:hypothetical protein [Ignavibacteriales bacterium]
MELIFIGTSSGRTSLTKFHSSLLFKINSKNILIDSGDGISKALLNQKISANKITDIIFFSLSFRSFSWIAIFNYSNDNKQQI